MHSGLLRADSGCIVSPRTSKECFLFYLELSVYRNNTQNGPFEKMLDSQWLTHPVYDTTRKLTIKPNPDANPKLLRTKPTLANVASIPLVSYTVVVVFLDHFLE